MVYHNCGFVRILHTLVNCKCVHHIVELSESRHFLNISAKTIYIYEPYTITTLANINHNALCVNDFPCEKN